MSVDLSLPVESALYIAVHVIDTASKDQTQHALATAVAQSRDLSISHTRREVWKQLARLLRKQLKQY